MLLHDLESNSMKKSSLPIPVEGERCTEGATSSRSCPIFLRLVSWCLTAVWRTCVDWRSKRPFLTRVTAHLSIIALALITIFLGGVGIPTPRAAVGNSLESDVVFSIEAAPVAEPEALSLPLTLSGGPPLTLDADTVSRHPE